MAGLATPTRNQGQIGHSSDVFAFGRRVLAPLRLFVFFVTLQLAIGPSPFYGQGGEIVQQSRLQYYLVAFSLSLSILSFIIHIPFIWKYLVRNIDLISFLIFVTFAAMKSGDPLMVLASLHYLEIFSAVGVMVLVDGSAVTRRRLYVFCLYMVLAHMVAFAVPSISIMRGGTLDGYFRGFASHRNVLAMGLNLASAVILFEQDAGRFTRLFTLLCCAVMIVFAGSMQGVIMTIVMAAVFMLYRVNIALPGAKGVLLFVLGSTLSLIYVLAPPDLFGQTLALFGRDTTFTGRDSVWSLAMYMIERVPFYGYGMQQFTSETLPPDLLKFYKLGITFGSAHSSYLEAILDFGWVGATMFFVVVGRHSLRITIDVFRLNGRKSALPLTLTLFCVLGGLVEAERLIVPGIGWIVFMLAKLLFDAGDITLPIADRAEDIASRSEDTFTTARSGT